MLGLVASAFQRSRLLGHAVWFHSESLMLIGYVGIYEIDQYCENLQVRVLPEWTVE